MSVERSRWEGNEIILIQDLNDNGEKLIESMDQLFSTFGESAILTGLIMSQQTVPDMTFKLDAGILWDNAAEQILNTEEFLNVSVTASNPTQDRYDIIEVRRTLLEKDLASRKFKDPISSVISSASINTVTEYKIELKVLPGTPGGIAPAEESGWKKIGEILVPTASTTVVDANIYNVDAEISGKDNTSWTNSINSIYRNGTISEMKSIIVPEEVSISATGAFNPVKNKSYILNVNTAGGDVVLTLGDGAFIGQKVTVNNVGANLVEVNGTGLDGDGEWISLNHAIEIVWMSGGWETQGQSQTYEVTLSSTQTYQPVFRNTKILANIGASNVTITLSPPEQDGQRVFVDCEGTGLLILNDNESGGIIPDAGIKLTDEYSVELLAVGGKWKTDSNGITGKATDSRLRTKYYADGTFSASYNVGPDTGGIAVTNITLPFSFDNGVITAGGFVYTSPTNIGDKMTRGAACKINPASAGVEVASDTVRLEIRGTTGFNLGGHLRLEGRYL